MADRQSQQAAVNKRSTKNKLISPQLQMCFWTASHRVRNALRVCLSAIGSWGFTLAGTVCLALYAKSDRLVELQPVRDLQLAVGALVGTILALAFSLSIIPLQRAAESYSPSILRLFREHRGLQAVFLGLLSICFCCFGLIISPIFDVDPTATVPLVLLLLGVSLDLLRRLYVLITRLLEPQEAVRRLSEDARRKLGALHEALMRVSNLSWLSLPPEEQEKCTPEQYLAYSYEKSQAHDDFVRVRSAELAEIAQKATVRNDWSVAGVTLNAMHRLAIDAIECRKSALVFYPADFLVIKATAEKPLGRVYEDLLAVNRTAVRQGAENVSMMVIRTLGSIAEHMTNIRRPEPMQHSAPLAATPIFYCRSAVRETMAKGMDDAGYEGAATLAKVSHAAPTSTDVQDVHALVIDGIFEILNLFAVSPEKAVHLKEPLDRALEVLHGLVERKDFHAEYLTRDFLRKLEVLLPFGLALEVTEPMALARHPVGPPYDPSSNRSLLASLTARAESDRARPKQWGSTILVQVRSICQNGLRSLSASRR